MGKTQYHLKIYFLFFCCFPFLHAQEQASNYFTIVNEKHAEFETAFKENNNSEEQLALAKAYKKFARWQWFWQHRVDESGDLNRYSKAYFAPDHIDELRKHHILKSVEDPSWKIIGPETYPEGTNPSGIMGIGRIDAIVANPNHKNHVIIGASAGGIWETYNINDSIPRWHCLTNNLPIFTVNDLKIVDQTLYAATSNQNPILKQGDERYGLGILKKKLTDSIWQLSNQTFESKKIAVSKNNKQLLYAVGEKCIYKSTDAGNNWIQLADPISNIQNSKIFLTNIEINPDDDDIIVITGRLYIYNSTHNKEHDVLIFKSEDGGKNWTNLTSDLEKFINKEIELAQAKDKPISLTKGLKNHISTSLYKDTLFLCVQQMYRPNHVYFVTLDKAWKSFTLYNSLSKSNTYYYGTDNVDVRFQVIDTDEILIGNRKLRLINNKNHSVKALDNNYKYLHQDIRAIYYDRAIDRLLVGTDGGINMNLHKNNEKRFVTFSNVSGNLNLFLAFNMSYINQNGKRTVRIGTQDTGYYKSDYLEDHWTTWTRFGSFGEGMIYTDPYDPNIVYRINAGGHGGNIQKSINNGKNFTNTKVKAGNYATSPLEIDKNNTHHLIFDNYKKYDQYTLSISKDQMKTSVNIHNGIEELDKGMNLALALSEKDSTLFYVARKKPHFKDNGIYNSLYKATNFDFYNPFKISYTNLNDRIRKLDSTILKRAFITHIELNKNDENEIWMSFGNLEKGKKVFHSMDKGLNWTNISANLPNVPVNIIKYDTENKQLYIGNDYGVYTLNNNSKQWQRYGYGLPIAIVTSLAIDHQKNEIIAGTHGRSVWTTPIQKQQDIIINKDTVWNINRTVKGDIIIKKGNTLNVNKAHIHANNIIIENGATLNVFSSHIISNHKNSYVNYFNTNLIVKPFGKLNISNSKIENYTIDINPKSTISLYGRDNIILKQTQTTIHNNANYLQHKKTPLQLLDKNTSLRFLKNARLGKAPNVNKINKIKFKGNGKIVRQ